MYRRLPNQLTVGRVALAVVFFVLLGLYDADQPRNCWQLDVALVVYLLAGLTDVLDGWLARRWNVTSAFGRIVDPFVDKVLVCGAFVMLTGANFAVGPGVAGEFERSLPRWLTGGMYSCVQAWMVVTILSREFIVSAIRGYSESQGVKFPAIYAGKIKMFVQSASISVGLLQMANFPDAAWAVVLKVVLVWLAAIVTVLSGLAYVGKARRLILHATAGDGGQGPVA